MATAAGEVAAIAHNPSENQVDGLGQRTRVDEARRVYQAHRAGLESRRDRDLLSEKLLLHIDGSGDFQWADIFHGTRVEIPRFISEYRKTENLLRIVVDNAVAHHTTMPLRYFAESSPDRQARERALVDTVWINYLAHVQRFSELFAEALYLAMPAGFGIVHAYWRDDVEHDWFEPVGGGERQYAPRGPGMIDTWCGNPFGTVFDRSARRGSVRWCSYERSLPADAVRLMFGHLPEARSLEGSTRLTSAAEFQQIARTWQQAGLGIHGSPVLQHRRGSDDEMLTVICRETAPGVLADYPDGRLQMIAVPGNVDPRRGEGSGGNAVLLADQPLPAGDFSWSLFYSHHRGSDIHGKPWVEDIDQLQVDLNIALSKRWEAINRMLEAPIIAPGGAIHDDMTDVGGWNLLELEPSMAAWRPRQMEMSQNVLPALDNEIKEKRSAIYTIGGYQAASRGEAPGSRMAYRAIVALQQADSSIHGPVNMRFRGSGSDFAQRCWRQMKKYGDVPWLIDIAGDEYAHLVEPYVDATKLSNRAPRYKLINAFGPSPELWGQEIIELSQVRGADGQPFLRTDEARRQYPNAMLFDDAGNPAAVKRRRADTIAKSLLTMARQLREDTQMQENELSHPWVQQAAQHVFKQAEQLYQRMRDDDLMAHIESLSGITQDETADPIARLAAMLRQEKYFEWQAMMAGQQQPMQAAGAGPEAVGPQPRSEAPAGDAGAAAPSQGNLQTMAM